MDSVFVRNGFPALDLACAETRAVGADIGVMIEDFEVVKLKQENAYLRAELEIIRKERNDYCNSLRESQKLHDWLVIMLNKRMLQDIALRITT